MQRGHQLQFSCIQCKEPIPFSILDSNLAKTPLQCPHCHKTYAFCDQNLLHKLNKFEALCRQIHESEEILGDTAVAIDVGAHNVKIPYRLLLTRLSSVLELNMGGHRVDIAFRIDPLKDVPESLQESPTCDPFGGK